MNNGNIWVTILPLVILIAVMYFLLIRPQKKREKEVNAMRSSVQVGDEIITIGGICGKVVKTKEDSLVIQVGADRVKFEIMRWSVSKVVEESEKRSVKAQDDDIEQHEEAEEIEVKKSKPKRIKRMSAVSQEAEETEEEKTEKPEEQQEAEDAAAEEKTEDAAKDEEAK